MLGAKPIAVATEASAMIEPTERSMPPLTMTKVIPIAPKPTITVWFATICMLRNDRNPSAFGCNPKTSSTNARPTKGRMSCRTCARLICSNPRGLLHQEAESRCTRRLAARGRGGRGA